MRGKSFFQIKQVNLHFAIIAQIDNDKISGAGGGEMEDVLESM